MIKSKARPATTPRAETAHSGDPAERANDTPEDGATLKSKARPANSPPAPTPPWRKRPRLQQQRVLQGVPRTPRLHGENDYCLSASCTRRPTQ